jgi:tetratricopeptide (TPR) repeat protein
VRNAARPPGNADPNPITNIKMNLQRLRRSDDRPTGVEEVPTSPPSARAERVDYRSMGDVNRDVKKWHEAAAAYARHLESYPEDDAIWIQRGNCLKEAGELAQSLAAYKRAEQLNGANYDVYLQLGHLHKITGHLAEALQSYERAAVLNPDSGDAKHEIRNTLDLISASPEQRPQQILSLFTSLDQLITSLKQQPEEEDVFTSYFRSVSGR